MANPVDSTVRNGWKAELEPYPEAGQMEFLRWFYQNSDDQERNRLKLQFIKEQKKAVPDVGLI